LIVEYSKGEDVITLAQTGYLGVFEKTNFCRERTVLGVNNLFARARSFVLSPVRSLSHRSCLRLGMENVLDVSPPQYDCIRHRQRAIFECARIVCINTGDV